MDGIPTGFSTPHNFTGLTARAHTFTVPDVDAWGNPFRRWFTGETTSTVTVSTDGIYTAQYYAPSSVESCDAAGNKKDSFIIGETVHVMGTGYAPSKTYNVYVVADLDWTDKLAIPTRIYGTATQVTSDPSGNLLAAVWPIEGLTALGEYDIVLDGNENGQYEAGIDALDNNDIQITAGFTIIPEYLLSLALPLFMVATLLVAGFQRMKETKLARTKITMIPAETAWIPQKQCWYQGSNIFLDGKINRKNRSVRCNFSKIVTSLRSRKQRIAIDRSNKNMSNV